MRLHVIICAVIMFGITISQRHFGKRFYENRGNKKYYKQYKIVNIITACILFIMMMLSGIYLVYFADK
jgi:hypothetical protein